MSSYYMKEAENFLTTAHNYETFINYKHHEEAMLLIEKLLSRCLELEKSRDNWKQKARAKNEQ